MNRYTPDENYLERAHELDRRFARDLEREPRAPIRPAARRTPFRYWAGLPFRPVRREPGRNEHIRRAS